MPSECFTDDVGFDLSLVVEGEVTKVSTPYTVMGFAANVCFWPDMGDAVRAWLNDGHHVGKGVRFFDVGDDDVDNVSWRRAWNKKDLTVDAA